MAEHGKFYWNELMARDTDTCGEFYKNVVGWKTEAMSMGDGPSYTLWRAGDDNAGGMLRMEGAQYEGAPAHWISYVAVDDVDAAVAKAEAAGGSVHAPAFDVPTVGRIAIIADPEGATLGLITPAAA